MRSFDWQPTSPDGDVLGGIRLNWGLCANKRGLEVISPHAAHRHLRRRGGESQQKPNNSALRKRFRCVSITNVASGQRTQSRGVTRTFEKCHSKPAAIDFGPIHAGFAGVPRPAAELRSRAQKPRALRGGALGPIFGGNGFLMNFKKIKSVVCNEQLDALAKMAAAKTQKGVGGVPFLFFETGGFPKCDTGLFLVWIRASAHITMAVLYGNSILWMR